MRKAIETYIEIDACSVKSGLKIALAYVIKKAAVIIKGSLLTQADFSADSIESNTAISIKKANEINMFVSV